MLANLGYFNGLVLSGENSFNMSVICIYLGGFSLFSEKCTYNVAKFSIYRLNCIGRDGSRSLGGMCPTSSPLPRPNLEKSDSVGIYVLIYEEGDWPAYPVQQ